MSKKPAAVFRNGALFMMISSSMSAFASSQAAEPADLLAQKRAAAQFVTPFTNELDCENVGYVQSAEVDEHFFPIFNGYDVDRSRSVSREELLADPYIKDKGLLSLSFDMMDGNKDGEVAPWEFAAYLKQAIDMLDTDQNGDVYPAEMKSAAAERKPRIE